MKRRAAALVLAGASILSFDVEAQGILDLFDFGRSEREAPRPARDAPRGVEPERKRPEAATKARKARDAAKGQPPAPAKPEAESAATAPPPPYEGQLVRLSEVLGALAFLRELCEAGDGDLWREKMSALIQAEAPSGPRRDKYVAAFNRGFRGYELTYRTCTQNARDASVRFLDEAGKISRDVSYRFGSP